MLVEDETQPLGSPTESQASTRWLVLLAVCPFLVSAVMAIQTPWSPASDEAVFLAALLDGPGELPLVGAYSRYGWSHPGPSLYWWFAGPSWLSNGATTTALLAAVALKGLAAAGAVWLSGRQSGWAGASLMVAITTVVVVAQPAGPYAIWNPTIVVVVYLAGLVAAWSVANGDPWGLPILAVSTTLCVHAHVGYLLVVAVPVSIALGFAAVRSWRRRPLSLSEVPQLPAAVWVTALAMIALWLPVAWDQFFGSGNLGELIRYFSNSRDPSLGPAAALQLGARAYLPWGPWAGGSEPLDAALGVSGVSFWWLALPLAGIGWASWRAWRNRDSSMIALTALAGGTAAAGLLSLVMVKDVPYPHVLAWSRGIAGFLWFTVALSVLRALVDARPIWTTALRRGVTGLAVAVVVWGCIVAPNTERPRERSSDAVLALLPAALGAVPQGSSASVVLTEAYSGVADGLVYGLAQEGRSVIVREGRLIDFAPWGDRTGSPDTKTDVELAVAVGPAIISWDADERWTSIARWEPLNESERSELRTLDAQVTRSDAEDGRRRELLARGEVAALYLKTDPSSIRGE